MTKIQSMLTGLQTRDNLTALEVRESDDGAREVAGVGVPFNQPIEFWGIREQFAPGSIEVDDAAMLVWRHTEPIGKIASHHSDDEGWHHRSVISKTPRGDEAYTLARDGVISKFSIGFEPIEHIETKDDDGTITITHTKVRLREVSLVPFPAYEGAQLTEVREMGQNKEETAMTENAVTVADLDEVRASVDEIGREVRLLGAPADEPAGPLFRSFGEYVKAVAGGDEAALRAYEGAVSGDTVLKDAWVGSLVHLIGEKQRVKSAFSTGALPAEGMGVEYAVLEDDSTQVAEQAAEGDDLAFGKVSIETERAAIKTFGGYSSLSRQAIERANVGILDTTFTALAIKYAKALENYVRTVVTAGVAAADAVEADLTTQDGVVAAILDLVEAFDDNDRTLSGLFVSKDVFLGLLAVPANDRILQVTTAPTDKVGTATISSATGNIAGVPVSLFPGAAAGTAFGYDSFAVKTLESPGAPLRLQDENIINLTKDFSVYGYATAYVQAPNGLVRIDEAA